MRQERLDRLSRIMARRGVDQVLIGGDLELFYYTGIYEETMERLRVLLVDREGGWRCYTNQIFQTAGLEGQVFRHRDSGEQRALEELAAQLRTGGTIAVDETWRSGHLLRLLPMVPRCALCPAGDLLSVPMACKDQEELALLERSSQINDRVVAELIASIGSDSTEAVLCRAIQDLYDKHGADGREGGALVAFGANCASPHPAPRRICPQPGDCILIDAGAPYERYQSDMTRTVFFRDVGTELEKIYRVVLEANLAGIDAVRPGRTAGDIDKACRQVIEKSGYGAYFTHRTGHGIGLHLHEAPYISRGAETVLREGMVFSVEPGIYVPELGGVRIEDLVAVTQNGVKVLNRLSKELQVLQ